MRPFMPCARADNLYLAVEDDVRKVLTLVYLFFPSILVSGPIWSSFIERSFERYVIVVYLITIIGIILFFKYNLCRFYALILGLILSPLCPFLWAFLWAEVIFYYPYRGFSIAPLFAIIATIFYVLPFVLISFTTFFIISIARNKRTV